jgi:2-polyprenyl-6-methoxyphenol hydroxylase-like FAD-dependent oxidoreductase
MKAVIIGGGIGGLSTAIALARVGIEPLVFEQADQLREVGAGLTFWTNGLTALDMLGAAEGVLAASCIVNRFEQRTWRGDVLTVLPWGKVETKNGAPAAICVHRRDLLDQLARRVDADRVHCGHRCLAMTESAAGVTARFANGREERADILVGADGLHSVIRAALHGESRPRYAGYTCWRGVANYHGTGLAADSAFEAWGPGKRFAMHPVGPGLVFWYATKNTPQGGADGTGGRKAEVIDCFRNWFPPIPEILAATNDILRNDIVDRKPISNWGRGRVTLLGDAAHPTTPNLGQGACMAIQDAVVLGSCLRQAEPEAALRAYERIRRRPTAAIVNLSWRAGILGQLQNPFACWIRNAITRLIPSAVSLKLMQSILRQEIPDLSAGLDSPAAVSLPREGRPENRAA